MSYLVFDTETTGLAQFRQPPTDPSQPNLVQLAAVLFDTNHEELMSLNVMVQPDGWIIPTQASDIHGIPTAKAEKYGIGLGNAVTTFFDMVQVADAIVAHNIKFDKIVMRRAGHMAELGQDIFENKQLICTMNSTTNILKIPGARGGYKWPKLIEVHQYLFDEGFDGAHDALVDVRACARVYRQLVEMGILSDGI